MKNVMLFFLMAAFPVVAQATRLANPNGFSIDYDTELFNPVPADEDGPGDISFCAARPDRVLCLTEPEGGMGVSVSVHPSSDGAETCNSGGPDTQDPLPSRTIAGTAFQGHQWIKTDGTHGVAFHSYTRLHAGKCYEVSAAVGTCHPGGFGEGLCKNVEHKDWAIANHIISSIQWMTPSE